MRNDNMEVEEAVIAVSDVEEMVRRVRQMGIEEGMRLAAERVQASGTANGHTADVVKAISGERFGRLLDLEVQVVKSTSDMIKTFESTPELHTDPTARLVYADALDEAGKPHLAAFHRAVADPDNYHRQNYKEIHDGVAGDPDKALEISQEATKLSEAISPTSLGHPALMAHVHWAEQKAEKREHTAAGNRHYKAAHEHNSALNRIAISDNADSHLMTLHRMGNTGHVIAGGLHDILSDESKSLPDTFHPETPTDVKSFTHSDVANLRKLVASDPTNPVHRVVLADALQDHAETHPEYAKEAAVHRIIADPSNHEYRHALRDTFPSINNHDPAKVAHYATVDALTADRQTSQESRYAQVAHTHSSGHNYYPAYSNHLLAAEGHTQFAHQYHGVLLNAGRHANDGDTATAEYHQISLEGHLHAAEMHRIAAAHQAALTEDHEWADQGYKAVDTKEKNRWVRKKVGKIMAEGIRGKQVDQKQAVAAAYSMWRKKQRTVKSIGPKEFHAAMHAEPGEHLHHLAYADYLSDNEHDHAAEIIQRAVEAGGHPEHISTTRYQHTEPDAPPDHSFQVRTGLTYAGGGRPNRPYLMLGQLSHHDPEHTVHHWQIPLNHFTQEGKAEGRRLAEGVAAKGGYVGPETRASLGMPPATEVKANDPPPRKEDHEGYLNEQTLHAAIDKEPGNLLHAHALHDHYLDNDMPHHARVVAEHVERWQSAGRPRNAGAYEHLGDPDVPEERDWHTAITAGPAYNHARPIAADAQYGGDGHSSRFIPAGRSIFLTKRMPGTDPDRAIRHRIDGLREGDAADLARGLHAEASRQHGANGHLGILMDANASQLAQFTLPNGTQTQTIMKGPGKLRASVYHTHRHPDRQGGEDEGAEAKAFPDPNPSSKIPPATPEETEERHAGSKPQSPREYTGWVTPGGNHISLNDDRLGWEVTHAHALRKHTHLGPKADWEEGISNGFSRVAGLGGPELHIETHKDNKAHVRNWINDTVKPEHFHTVHVTTFGHDDLMPHETRYEYNHERQGFRSTRTYGEPNVEFDPRGFGMKAEGEDVKVELADSGVTRSGMAYHHYYATFPTGKRARITLNHIPGEDTVKVHYVGPLDDNEPLHMTVSQSRSIQRQVLTNHPDVKYLTGTRIGGAKDEKVIKVNVRKYDGTIKAVTNDTLSIVWFPTTSIQTDEGIQYKESDGSGDGLNEERRQDSGTFDPFQVPPLALWQSDDGQTYVVDGHKRLGSARRNGCPVVRAYFVQAKSVEDAKRKGEQINVGMGTKAMTDEQFKQFDDEKRSHFTAFANKKISKEEMDRRIAQTKEKYGVAPPTPKKRTHSEVGTAVADRGFGNDITTKLSKKLTKVRASDEWHGLGEHVAGRYPHEEDDLLTAADDKRKAGYVRTKHHIADKVNEILQQHGVEATAFNVGHTKAANAKGSGVIVVHNKYLEHPEFEQFRAAVHKDAAAPVTGSRGNLSPKEHRIVGKWLGYPKDMVEGYIKPPKDTGEDQMEYQGGFEHDKTDTGKTTKSLPEAYGRLLEGPVGVNA